MLAVARPSHLQHRQLQQWSRTSIAAATRLFSSPIAPEPTLSTVHRGNAFELRALLLLRELSMSLRRIGGKDDGGIDLCGWWWLPPLSSSSSSLPSPSGMRDDLTVIATNEEGVTRRRVRVIAQCKAERKKLGPNYVREMEGVLHRHLHMPKDTDTQQLVVPTVALLVSESAFTKSTVLRALSSPLPFMLLHLPRVVSDASDVDSNGESDTGTLDSFGSAIWNPALGGQRGILAGDIDLRWELSGSVGGSRRPSLWWRGTRLESWVPPYER